MSTTPNFSDEELLSRLKDKATAETAFGDLVTQYSQMLYAVIRRIVYRHEDADDVLQNTFIKAWRNIHNFKGNSKLSTWLYTIATNEALTHLRKERSNRKLPLTTEDYDLTELLTGDPYFDGDQAEAEFLAAIDQLPEKQKLTFELRYFDDLPYKEISEITGTSEGALKANYHHAVKKLKSFMGIDEEEK
ncbi:MAG: RNA polymerase sigma factor [Porphyromonas sp.]|nr:RNA polymerase sigma factor [Porphyromonas sp.]